MAFFHGPMVVKDEIDIPKDPGDVIIICYKGETVPHALFKCPCQCGDNICLPLKEWGSHDGPKKSWEYRIDPKTKRFTMSPSLQQTHGRCRSHFFITDGMVKFV